MSSDQSTTQNFAPKPPQPPEPPRPPAPPEPFELVQRPSTERNKGLFDELLMGNFLVLYYDTLDRPGLYDEPSKQLLEELASGQKKIDQLNGADRALLDLSTLAYATSPPAQPHIQKRERLLTELPKKLAAVANTTWAGPEEALPAFWWLR